MKKTFGIFFLLIATLFTIALLFRIPDLITGITNIVNESNGTNIGYFLGQIIFLMVFATITFGLFFIGIKWVLLPFIEKKKIERPFTSRINRQQ